MGMACVNAGRMRYKRTSCEGPTKTETLRHVRLLRRRQDRLSEHGKHRQPAWDLPVVTTCGGGNTVPAEL